MTEPSPSFWTAPVELADPAVFMNGLLRGANAWWHDQLWAVLRERFGDEPPAGIVPGYGDGAQIDFETPETLLVVFNSKTRNAAYGREASQLMRAALNGGGGSLQGNPWMGWLLNGFGIWSVLFGLGYALDATVAARGVLRDVLGLDADPACTGLPTVIFKPPSKRDGDLLCHNDAANGFKLYRHCLDLREGDFGDWIRRHGVQTLLHLSGAGGRPAWQHARTRGADSLPLPGPPDPGPPEVRHPGCLRLGRASDARRPSTGGGTPLPDPTSIRG